jgi:hypothetical protein
VHTIGQVIGRPLRHEEIPPEAARQQMLTESRPPSVADGILNAHAEFVTKPELVTPTVDEVTGAPARAFRERARDHAGDFR